jgi:type I restriction enzyme R subunit
MKITEEQLENLVLSWFGELGYSVKNGLDIAPEAPEAERTDYRQVILRERLRTKLIEINPEIPAVAIEDAIQQITNLNSPSLLHNNREFHRFLRDGIKVEFQKDGETVGDFVKLFDFKNYEHNEFLTVNQFSIRGAKHTKRPDIIVFINGLPIAVIELKNPADVKTNIVSSFHQLQTYKETIPDLFNTNEILVIADGREARAGSLTADIERFTAWRTVDGKLIDPLGKSNETETLIRGLFRRDFLLEYLRDFIIFEDDGEITKKIAAYHQFHAVRKAYQETIEAVSGEGKIGVVWHTQGSGKSISMAFYAGKIITAPEMKNPTIVVVTDRNDLDGQLFKTFSDAKELMRETPKQAEDAAKTAHASTKQTIRRSNFYDDPKVFAF